MTWEPHDKLPDEPEAVYICDDCRGGISDGKGYYLVGGMFYCEECMESYKQIAYKE